MDLTNMLSTTARRGWVIRHSPFLLKGEGRVGSLDANPVDLSFHQVVVFTARAPFSMNPQSPSSTACSSGVGQRPPPQRPEFPNNSVFIRCLC